MKNLLELIEALTNTSDYQGAAELFLLHTNTKLDVIFKDCEQYLRMISSKTSKYIEMFTMFH